MLAAGNAAPGTQPAKEFRLRARTRHLGVGAAGGSQCVRVAAAHCGFAQSLRHFLRRSVVAGEHVAVARLVGREERLEPVEIFDRPPPGQAGKQVVDAEKQSLLTQVGQQRGQVVAAALDFRVLPLSNVVHADVRLGAAGHPAGNLFAQEKPLEAAKRFGAVYGIVVGQRNQIHPAAAQRRIDRPGSAVAFPAHPVQPGHLAHARVVGVHMQVASHVSRVGTACYGAMTVEKKAANDNSFSTL